MQAPQVHEGINIAGGSDLEASSVHDSDETLRLIDTPDEPSRCGTLLRQAVARVRTALTFAIPMSLQLMLFATSFSQYFSSAIFTLHLMIDLELSPVALTQFFVFQSWVYWGAPLYGWFSDVTVFRNERRRVCIVGGLLLLVIAWTVLAVNYSVAVVYGVAIAQVVPSSVANTALNGLLVEIGAAETNPGVVQSEAMIIRTAGSLAGSVAETLLLMKLSVADTMLFVPVCMAVCLLPAFWIECPIVPTHRESLITRATNEFERLINGIRLGTRSNILAMIGILLFVFVYTVMPDGSVIYGDYLERVLFVAPWYYSFVHGLGLVGGIVGCSLYMKYMSHRRQMALFVAGCVFNALVHSTNIMLVTEFSRDTLHLSNNVFYAIDNFVSTMFSRMAYMPIVHVAAERAPKGYESTVFECFTAASIGGSTVSGMITVGVAKDLHITKTNWSNLWLLLVICSGAKLLPILGTVFLPARDEDRQTAEEGGAPEATPVITAE